MEVVSKADREAARALREVLADVSGFWHHFDDERALCQALARHRIAAEKRAPAAARRLMRPVPSPAERRIDQPAKVVSLIDVQERGLPLRRSA